MGTVIGLLISLSIEYLQYWSTLVESLLRMVSAGKRTVARFTGTDKHQPL